MHRQKYLPDWQVSLVQSCIFHRFLFAIGQVTIIAIVLFTIAAERIPDISPIPYSAPRLFLILPLIAPTSHSNSAIFANNTNDSRYQDRNHTDTKHITHTISNCLNPVKESAASHTKSDNTCREDSYKSTTATLIPINAAPRTIRYGRTSMIL